MKFRDMTDSIERGNKYLEIKQGIKGKVLKVNNEEIFCMNNTIRDKAKAICRKYRSNGKEIILNN